MFITLANRRRRRFCLPFLFVAIVILLSGSVLGDVFIKNAEEFEEFSINVNAGTSYERATVFLEADIDFSGKTLEPVGKNSDKYFKGTFDGQGHIIEGLKMESTLQYSGIFGYSSGMTVRNIVVGQGSLFTSSCTDTENVYIGGIMGQCVSDERPCIIENVVNMGSITFNHDITANLFLGGIAGHLSEFTYEVVVRNCANYGKVSFTGVVNEGKTFYIGGISGYSGGTSTRPVYIQNCLNYGELSESGNMNGEVFIGGIFGESSYTYIENCVSGGRISSTSSGSFGSIVGNPASSTYTAHSFWTGDTGHNKAYGSGSSSSTDTYLITPNITAVNNLNDYEFITRGNKWNKWLLNANNKTVTFFINNTSTNPISISVSTQIILLPNTTVDSGYTFYWYTDAGKSKLFESVVISENITLYGGVTKSFYMVTFDLRGGESASGSGSSSRNITRIANYASPYGELPEVTKTGHTFNGWFTDVDGRGSEVTSETTVTIASDHTLYACWTINKYIVTFDFGNGTTTDKSFEFDKQIVYPEEVSEREGYTFNGWTPKPDTMPSHDLVIAANWTEIHNETQVNSTEFVEIVFGSKDLKEEDVEMIIAKYTDDTITIVRFERDEETGGIRVIVKFTDKKQAESFVENINSSSEIKSNVIIKVSFIQGNAESFSNHLYLVPHILFLL